MIQLEKNSFGSIKFNREILDKLIEESVIARNGDILLANSKGKISKKYKSGNSYAASIYYSENQNSFYVNIFTAFKFGASLNRAIHELSEDILTALGKILGKKKIELTIKVKGILHKDIVKKETDLEFVFKSE